MAVVVSDTSPIRALSHLGMLPLLARLFGNCIVPDRVARELLRPNKWLKSVDVRRLSFMEVRTLQDRTQFAEISKRLDEGEAEAIALALELQADVLLIDETAGRAAARQYGLNVTGVLGVLLSAKQQGEIPEIRPSLDRLRTEINFFVSDAVYQAILLAAGE